MILSKMEEATMMGSRRLDSKRARPYTIKELGIMAGDELNGISVD